MKAFILYHLPIVPQEVHTNLQVRPLIHVSGHNIVVRPVEQDFSQKLYRLPLGDIGIRIYQYAVVSVKKEIKVRVQVVRR